MTIDEIKTMSAAETAKQLQEAMVDIATVFAGAVAGLKYIKPKESEVK